jgi:hypothetical protein
VLIYPQKLKYMLIFAISEGKGGRILNDVVRLSSLNLFCGSANRVVCFITTADFCVDIAVDFCEHEANSPEFFFSDEPETSCDPSALTLMDLASFTFDASLENPSFPLASACLTELAEPFCNIVVYLLEIGSRDS